MGHAAASSLSVYQHTRCHGFSTMATLRVVCLFVFHIAVQVQSSLQQQSVCQFANLVDFGAAQSEPVAHASSAAYLTHPT